VTELKRILLQAIDFLKRRGELADRRDGNPAVVLLDLNKELGLFWAVVNQPPPGSLSQPMGR